MANQRLEELASIDPLTGASNRRYFLEQARIETSRAKRQGHALSVIMLDIDFFKSINDRFGHEIGDKVLVALAATIRAVLRTGHFCPPGGRGIHSDAAGQGLAAAVQVAERLRLLIAGMAVAECPVTVSAGVSGLQDESDEIDNLLRRAGRGLYLAKNQGRNRVRIWQVPTQGDSGERTNEGADGIA